MDIDRFVTLLVDRRLCRRREADTLASVFEAERVKAAVTATAEQLAEFLVDSDRLTRWQCEKLLMGKWRGFYLGDYLLLE
jgi:hypothetical protein